MKILIIDIETTGFLKGGGKITEVGAVELCLETYKRKVVFDKIVNPEISDKELDESWIVSKGYMTAQEIKKGVPFESIKEDLQALIDSYPSGATAFNRSFDMDFLESYGIVFPKKLPCLMLTCRKICKMVPNKGYLEYKWPKVEEAYAFLFPEKLYFEEHRGADDAMHEAEIAAELHRRKKSKAEPLIPINQYRARLAHLLASGAEYAFWVELIRVVSVGLEPDDVKMFTTEIVAALEAKGQRKALAIYELNAEMN